MTDEQLLEHLAQQTRANNSITKSLEEALAATQRQEEYQRQINGQLVAVCENLVKVLTDLRELEQRVDAVESTLDQTTANVLALSGNTSQLQAILDGLKHVGARLTALESKDDGEDWKRGCSDNDWQ